MAFKFHKSLKGTGMPPLVRVIVDNSDTVQIGDAVKAYNAGNAEVATAARPILGIVHDIQLASGLAPTWNSGTDDTYTVASDNETVGLVAVLVDCDQASIYSGAQDGTVGATNSSDKIGASMDIADEGQLDESTALRNAQGQMYCWGTDPNSSTRILCSIMESEVRAGGVYS
jgi:hypothetical protein